MRSFLMTYLERISQRWGELEIGTNLSIRANLGLIIVGTLGGDGPVDQEEVDIVELELLKGGLDGPLN